jgi:ABC-type branched-subunit amino acid transport system ATPase component
MCQPTLLFLDEPSSGLDHHETDEMCEVLTTIQAERGTAILLVEHDVPMVEKLAERCYVIDVGRMIADGPTREVLTRPEVRAAYLGQGV